MEWPYLALGPVELVAADQRGVLVAPKSYRPETLIRLVPNNGTFVAETTDTPRSHRTRAAIPAPFERTALGRKARLAWPAGATQIGEWARIAGWAERFAIVLDDRAVSVIDATSDRVVRLVLPDDALKWAIEDPIARFGHVFIGLENGVLAIPFATLENLAAGTAELALVRHFPCRKRDAKLACVFLWFLQDGRAMVEIGDGKGGVNEPKLTIAMPSLGLAKYAPVILADELYPMHFNRLEAPGHAPVTIGATAPLAIGSVKVTVTRAKDPAAVAKAPRSSTPPRNAGDLEQLLAAIAANPEDDAQRAVLADLLLEQGDPSAEAIAKVRAGGKLSAAKLKEALGPLGLYLTKIELVGGFPVEATVARDAPDEDDHPAELAAACADFRLGMIRALHTQPGRRAAPGIYARLIGAPIATALRRVDVSDQESVDALIAANRDQLEYLEHVDFANADRMAQLATALFDRVTTVHTVCGLAHAQPLINRLRRDKSTFFARAPRRLVLDETRDRNADLFAAFAPAWPELPVTALTIAGVTVERAGEITGSDAALVAAARQLFR